MKAVRYICEVLALICVCCCIIILEAEGLSNDAIAMFIYALLLTGMSVLVGRMIE